MSYRPKALSKLGERVRLARQCLGLSQALLGERIGYDQTYVSHVERGRRLPSVANLRKLAIELDTTTDRLVGLD